MLQQHMGSIDKATQSWEKKEAEVGTVIATAIKAAADSANNYERPQRDKEHSLQRGIFWVTMLGVIFAGVAAAGAWYYASVAKRQLVEMIDATKQTRRSADAAACAAKTSQQALRASVDQFRLDQRPWVGIKDITCDICNGRWPPNDDKSLGLIRYLAVNNLKGVIINMGKTPAEGVVLQFNFHYGAMRVNDLPPECKDLHGNPVCRAPSQYQMSNFIAGGPDPRNLGNLRYLPINEGVVPPDQTNGIVFQPYSSHVSEIQIFVDKRDDKPFMYVDGTIKYYAVWDKGRKKVLVTNFCFYPAYSNPDPPKGQNYYYCDTPGSNTMR